MTEKTADSFRGKASDDELREFLVRALAVWSSDDPKETHVVMSPEILDAIGTYIDSYAHADASFCDRSLLPPSLVPYSEQYSGNKLSFSDLCMAGMLTETIAHRNSWPDCACPEFCVPKYLIEAMFHIMLSPGFAHRARQWYTVQDYT